MNRILTLSEFKTLARKDKAEVGDVRIIKAIATSSAKVANADTRTLDARITTATRDRDSDTIAAGGWQLANYRKNPVVLFCHDYSQLPVAKDTGLQVDEIGLRGSPQFMPADMSPMSDMVYRMYAGGFLNAFSVGMRPLTWSYNEDENGVDFLTQELLEYSCVPVPANPEALNGAKSAGIDLKPMLSWAVQALDTWDTEKGLYIPRGTVERALKIVEGERIVVLVPGRLTESEAKSFAQKHGASLVVFQKDGEEPAPAATTTATEGAAAEEKPADPAPEDKPAEADKPEDAPEPASGVSEDLLDDKAAFAAVLSKLVPELVGAAVDRKLREATGKLD